MRETAAIGTDAAENSDQPVPGKPPSNSAARLQVTLAGAVRGAGVRPAPGRVQSAGQEVAPWPSRTCSVHLPEAGRTRMSKWADVQCRFRYYSRNVRPAHQRPLPWRECIVHGSQEEGLTSHRVGQGTEGGGAVGPLCCFHRKAGLGWQLRLQLWVLSGAWGRPQSSGIWPWGVRAGVGPPV